MKKITLNDFNLVKSRKLFNNLRKKVLLSDDLIEKGNYTDAIYNLFKKECGKFDNLLRSEFEKLDDVWISQLYYSEGKYYEHTIDYGLWQKYIRNKYKESKNIRQLEKIRGLLLNIRTWLWFNWNNETISMEYRWLGKWFKPKIVQYKGERYLEKDVIFIKKIKITKIDKRKEFKLYFKKYFKNEKNYIERKEKVYGYHYTIKIRHFINYMMNKMNIVVEKEFSDIFLKIVKIGNLFTVVSKRIGLPYYGDGFYFDPEKRIYVIQTSFY